MSLAQTLDVVTRLSHIVKRGLLKQRIFAATWSMIVFLAIQSYLTSTMSMVTNTQLMVGVSLAYIFWVGAAYWQIRRLDAEYKEKLAALEKAQSEAQGEPKSRI
jgi:nucleoside recognition membrane protein YjiH